LACKNNAIRHGHRSVQTVVPGEDPGEWEAHRSAVVADLRPEGAVELALAETVTAKLWRLGRVVGFEADVIANGQDPDELALAHEKAHRRVTPGGPNRADIPTRGVPSEQPAARPSASSPVPRVASRGGVDLPEPVRGMGVLLARSCAEGDGPRLIHEPTDTFWSAGRA
jgi:hypothetical protein